LKATRGAVPGQKGTLVCMASGLLPTHRSSPVTAARPLHINQLELGVGTLLDMSTKTSFAGDPYAGPYLSLAPCMSPTSSPCCPRQGGCLFPQRMLAWLPTTCRLSSGRLAEGSSDTHRQPLQTVHEGQVSGYTELCQPPPLQLNSCCLPLEVLTSWPQGLCS
jgi:hypothetical protein